MLPSGTLTFLFTDIEGSTRLWEQHPGPMAAAHALHGEIVTGAVEGHRGTLVRERGEGDSCFAVFPQASDAVAAIAAVQRALLAAAWPAEAPVRVRAALHSGEALQRDGDYNSSAVNRCARLRALAAGGQTLLSRATWELASDHLPPGVTFRDLGSHRLKDLQRPEHVFQLLHPDLPADFPPLRSLDALPNNLPQQLSRFIGREDEVAAVKALLAERRLVTLAGTGGVGKTRLSLQVAAELVEAYPDGVWFVDLAPLAAPELVAPAVAAALRLREQPHRQPLDALAEALREKQLLIVLDNCEHLVAACAAAAEHLLRGCPHVQLLATSREALAIAGETVWRVPSLPLPAEGLRAEGDSMPSPQPSALSDCASVRLFVERARESRAAFELTPANAPAVARICRRLDGIPLAIELAAARARALTPEQILSRLDDRFQLLAGGSRVALPRQQTLRAALDWSHDLLSDPERALLRRLSVFAGGWTLEAAEAVCGDCGLRIADCGIEGRIRAVGNPQSAIRNEEVLDLLTSLVDKSLVLYEEAGEEGRYRLLETVRQYAAGYLAESGEEETARRRQCDQFLAFAEIAEPHLSGPEQLEWLGRLETEHENLRAALEFSLAAAPAAAPVPSTGAVHGGEAALRLAAALSRFWRSRDHLAEGRRQLARALAAPAAGVPPVVRAKALNAAGALAHAQGDFAAAHAAYEAGLALWRALGDGAGTGAALNGLGLVAKARGDYGAARALGEGSLAAHRRVGDERGAALALNTLGNLADVEGDYARATSLYEESLAIRRAMGDRWGIAIALNNLGLVADSRGDAGEARRLLEESLAIRRELGDRLGVASCLNNIGILEQAAGNLAAARALHAESLAIKRELGDSWGMALSLNNLQNVAVDAGDHAAAAAWQREAIGLLARLGDRGALAAGLEGSARLAQAARDLPRAARLLGAAAALRAAIGAPIPLKSRADYEQAVAAIRAALGAQPFAAAWAEGEALALEQAVDLALE